MKAVCTILALTLAIATLSCGDKKGDSVTGIVPGEGTIIGADPQSWSVDQVTIIGPPAPGCYPTERHNADVGEILSNGVFGFHGEAVPCGSHSQDCVPSSLLAVLHSSQRIDFSRYSAARLRCSIRSAGAQEYEGVGGLTFSSVTVSILSNVPGTPNLNNVVQAYAIHDTTTTPFDVSLENALSFREATVELRIEAACRCGHTGSGYSWDPLVYRQGSGFLEVSNFRIVGQE
jgi:hypothetical protein